MKENRETKTRLKTNNGSRGCCAGVSLHCGRRGAGKGGGKRQGQARGAFQRQQQLSSFPWQGQYSLPGPLSARGSHLKVFCSCVGCSSSPAHSHGRGRGLGRDRPVIQLASKPNLSVGPSQVEVPAGSCRDCPFDRPCGGAGIHWSPPSPASSPRPPAPRSDHVDRFCSADGSHVTQNSIPGATSCSYCIPPLLARPFKLRPRRCRDLVLK